MLSELVVKYLVLAEPQSDFFLRTLDSVGAVADISANVLYFSQLASYALLYFKHRATHNGIVSTNGPWGGGQRVRSTE